VGQVGYSSVDGESGEDDLVDEPEADGGGARGTIEPEDLPIMLDIEVQPSLTP
jgi:hypothetical protein